MESLHVQEPWFGYILSGKKTVEGRTGRRTDINKGDTLRFSCDDRHVLVRVMAVRFYDTLDAYLEKEWKCASGVDETLEKVKEKYLQVTMNNVHVFSEARIHARGGMTAIHFGIIDSK